MSHDELCPLSWSNISYPLTPTCDCQLIFKVVERERMIRQEEKRISYMEGHEQGIKDERKRMRMINQVSVQMLEYKRSFNQHGKGENP